MGKTRVVVLMGGVSSEHDVSLKSGRKVVEHLNAAIHDIIPVTITREGLWEFAERPPLPIFEAVPQLARLDPDCVFLALHGPFGEDGRIQGLLDLLEIPYIGSGCAASGIAIDKVRSKALVEHAGVHVARHVIVSRAEWERSLKTVLARVEKSLGFPCVMKSPCQGSSLGMSIPETPEAFEEDMPQLLELDDEVLVEEYLAGVEVTCGVLDVDPGRSPRALPVTEICPRISRFFDYEAKYTPGASEEITPARISPEETRRVQEAAVQVHMVIGCSGFSRSDMILVDGDPVWLEVNTIPGLTETSLFPQAAAAVGISFSELVGRLVEAAIARARREAPERV